MICNNAVNIWSFGSLLDKFYRDQNENRCFLKCGGLLRGSIKSQQQPPSNRVQIRVKSQDSEAGLASQHNVIPLRFLLLSWPLRLCEYKPLGPLTRPRILPLHTRSTISFVISFSQIHRTKGR